MRKLLSILLSLVLVFSLLACGSNEAAETTTPQTTTAATEPTQTEPPSTNPPTSANSVKILAIGNSFSVDAMQHLYTVLKAEGVEEIVLGNLYIGGCTLDTHMLKAQTDAKDYKFYVNTDGEWTSTPGFSLLDGLRWENWDIITMQQGSPKSGIADTYQPYLDQLIAFVNENKRNPDAKFYWHMTWAYQSDSTKTAFASYGNNQMTMYLGIVNALQQAVEPTGAFAGILPVGTAIQNARTGFVGDTLTRDGFHLSDLGRIIASYTWYAVVSDQPVQTVKLDKVGALTLTEGHKKLIVEAVNAAIADPYAVTESTVKTP